MLQETYDKVKANFGANAREYTTSTTHADAQSLALMVERVAPPKNARLLDIGTGAGHTAIAFAPHVAEVVAFDLTPQMLEETARNAAAKGITNLTTQQGGAEKLPFEDASFDVVTCRLTTHHFANLPVAVQEMARVLKPGGKLAIVDTSVPEDTELDSQINYIEVLRDPSHVRNYTATEWRELVEATGLTVTFIEGGYHDEGYRLDFDNWTGRMKTPPADVATLQNLFRNASPALRDVLEIGLDGDKISFSLPRITVIATRGE
jgi:ubiquinone/menaquinone biosynthesis C-methylase UbiE